MHKRNFLEPFMDKFSSKVGAVKEKIIFGGIILFIIYILVGILTGFFPENGSVTITFLSSILVIGLCLFCLLDNLNKISGENKAARFLATISLVAVPFFLIIYCLNAWGAIELTECANETSLFGHTYCSQTSLNFFGKAMVILGNAMSLGTIGSMTMSINSHNRRTIEISKITATVFLIIAIGIELYLTFADSLIISFYSNNNGIMYAAAFSILAWLSLTVFAFYLSHFDNSLILTPKSPLKAKVVTNSTPAILTVEEEEEPAEKDPIYPEPINKAPSHVEGESLHANPGEPLHELGDSGEHPVIGKATTSTEHLDDFETLDNQKNNGEED